MCGTPDGHLSKSFNVPENTNSIQGLGIVVDDENRIWHRKYDPATNQLFYVNHQLQTVLTETPRCTRVNRSVPQEKKNHSRGIQLQENVQPNLMMSAAISADEKDIGYVL